MLERFVGFIMFYWTSGFLEVSSWFVDISHRRSVLSVSAQHFGKLLY